MDGLPIIFEYKGKEYSGLLTSVIGAGSDNGTWFLMINKFYQGQLHITDNGWVFHSQTGEFKEMADYFGQYIIAWYDSHE